MYTSCGAVLISINPYKWHEALYAEDLMLQYSSAAPNLPPHLFQFADSALRALGDPRKEGGASNQSIIISGESGAGKTESTKIIMQ